MTFYYPLKLSENVWFPVICKSQNDFRGIVVVILELIREKLEKKYSVFRGYRKRPVAWNGLSQVYNK